MTCTCNYRCADDTFHVAPNLKYGIKYFIRTVSLSVISAGTGTNGSTLDSTIWLMSRSRYRTAACTTQYTAVRYSISQCKTALQRQQQECSIAHSALLGQRSAR